MPELAIYTDGACRGNGKVENIGAYAYIIFDDYDQVEFFRSSKAVPDTTNNKMEMEAAIRAISHVTKHFAKSCKIRLHSDSQYLVNAINKGWLSGWQKNGWKTASKDPVKNKEQWEFIIKAINFHDIDFVYVKGHASNEYNNECDKMCNKAMDNYLSSASKESVNMSDLILED